MIVPHVLRADAVAHVPEHRQRRFRRRPRQRGAATIDVGAAAITTPPAVTVAAADAAVHVVTARSTQICVRQSAAAAVRARDARGVQQRPHPQ